MITRPKRILHCGDLHAFPRKRHHEFREQTNRLCELIQKEKIELVYIGGDVIDSKARLTPEQVEVVTQFFYKISELCPVILIPGNHDMDLKQKGSLDSLTPIVDNIHSNHPIYYLKDTGIYPIYEIDWAVWSCIDNLNPFDIATKTGPNPIIGCFHGAVKGCKTDSEWIITETDVTVEEFLPCDNVFLADIHKRQSFRDGDIAYCGSWYQVKIDEEEHKGVLIWTLDEKKNKYTSTFHELKNQHGFKTFLIEDIDKIQIDDIIVPTEDFLIRLLYTGTEENYSAIKFHEFRKVLKSKLKNEVILQKRFKKNKQAVKIKKTIADTAVDFFTTFYKNQGIPEAQVTELKSIDIHYNKFIDNTDYQIGEYYIEEVQIENFLCYGENNVLNLTDLQGLVGLFAANTSGKSSILDAITFCLFNDSPKSATSITRLINDQKPDGTSAWVQIKLMVNGVKWRIKRTIIPTTQGGKVKLEVWETVEGKEIERHEESRPQTDTKVLRKLLGTKEIFLTTVLCTATNLEEFAKNKNSERLDLIMKFLGISIYDQKLKLCDEDLKKNGYLYEKLREELEKMIPLDELEKRKETLIEEKKEKTKLVVSLKREVEKHRGWNEQLEEKIKGLNIINVTKSLVDLNKELGIIDSEMKSKITTLNSLLDDKSKLESNWKEKAPITTPIPVLNLSIEREKIVQLRIEIKSWEDQLNSELCPTCGQVRNLIDKSQISKQIEEAKQALKKLQDTIKEKEEKTTQLHIAQTSYKGALATITLTESKIELLVNKQENLQQQIKIVEDNKLKLVKKIKHEEKIQFNLEQIKILTVEQQQHESNIMFIDKEASVVEGEMIAYTNKVTAISKEEDALKGLQLYKKGMHRTGIPSLILETYIPEINSEINNQVNDLFDLNVNFELNDNKLEVYFYYDEFLNNGKGKRDISQGSGMEATIINLAIRAALTRISLLPKPSLLMLDEIFSTLDRDNLQQIKPLLVRLKEQYYNIVVISHLDEIKDLPEHIIQLEKISGVTSILS